MEGGLRAAGCSAAAAGWSAAAARLVEGGVETWVGRGRRGVGGGE
jgi:hypothetical protein